MTIGRLIILEGPDGSGKSTLAPILAQLYNGRVIHHGTYKDLDGPALARTYVDSLMPALVEGQTIILDRCWLSEPIYGKVFRAGADRLGPVVTAMLNRLAMRAGATLIRCDPGWDAAAASYQQRRQLELLKDLKQLRQVYDGYRTMRTPLDWVIYDYTQPVMGNQRISNLRELSTPHPYRAIRTAGRWGAPAVLVGEAFGELKPDDHGYRWPFASFSAQGCSHWLTQHLLDGEVSERQLLWVNADQDLQWLPSYRWANRLEPYLVALGEKAAKALLKLNLPFHHINHPQYHRRFRAAEPYPLATYLRRILK